MNIAAAMLAFIAVLGIAAGQILFKIAADELQKADSIFAWMTNQHLWSALLIYGIATIFWVLALQRAALNVAYGIMSLAFIIVPLASAYFLEEKLTKGVLIGGAFILVGVLVAANYKG
jgi:drug/metabolite transporter (DMT)-like permease